MLLDGGGWCWGWFEFFQDGRLGFGLILGVFDVIVCWVCDSWVLVILLEWCVVQGSTGVISWLKSTVSIRGLWSYDDFMARHRVRLDCNWGVLGGLCVLVLGVVDLSRVDMVSSFKVCWGLGRSWFEIIIMLSVGGGCSCFFVCRLVDGRGVG